MRISPPIGFLLGAVSLIVGGFAIHTSLHYLGTGAIGTTYRIAQGETDGARFFRAECATWSDLGFRFSKSFPIWVYPVTGLSNEKEQYLLAREHLYTLVEQGCSKPKEVTITQLP